MAAAAYRRHLAIDPADVAIWVQLGHAEKEQGNFAAAESAYREGQRRAPSDTDSLKFLAYMLKDQGQTEYAFQVFLAWFELDASPEVVGELEHLQGRLKASPRVARPGAVMFAMQDIFNMFEIHSTTSGIQRVQAGVALAAMDDAAFDAHFIINGEYRDEKPTYLRLREEDLRDLIAYAASDAVDHAMLKRKAKAARFGAAPIVFGRDTTVVILGSFWGIGNGIDQYLSPRRAGVRIIPFIHDIIPVTHPEYCDANLTNFFWRGLAELLHAADFVLTNSDFTQAELKRFLVENGGRLLPMRTVPLAHSLAGVGTGKTMWPRILAPLKGKRYAAYVSTIEGRKNHLFVVRAWQEMIAQGVAVPDLVFVGREGWKVEPLMALLESTGYLGGRVHIVHGLSDAELNGIYAGAMFTIFTSVVEGWGLPVGESLTHGVPCVVSRTASLPEVGGEFADYVDPADSSGSIATFRRMIEDGAYLAERRRSIRQSFVVRNWDDVGRDMIQALREITTTVPVSELTPVCLPEGRMFRPGEITRRVKPMPGYVSNPLGLALIDGFYEPEPWGAWLRGHTGELSFLTTAAPGETIVVLLSLRPAPWAVRARCTMAMNGVTGGARRWRTLRAGTNLIRLQAPVADDATVTIRFIYEGEIEPQTGDARRFALGLNAIGYTRLGDCPGRIELREDILFG